MEDKKGGYEGMRHIEPTLAYEPLFRPWCFVGDVRSDMEKEALNKLEQHREGD